MIADYEDDTHFCLKCHSTIIGLDSYVSHRKAGCAKSGGPDLPKSPLPSQLLPPDESFGLKADDFFSSLELQSSSKKQQVQSVAAQSTSTSSSSTGRSFNRILTRSKTTAAIQAKDNHQEIPQSKSGKNVWIGGHQLKLGYGDNQSKLIKAVDNLERRKEDPPNVGVYADSEVESDFDDYDVEESSDEDTVDAPPRNHTGGKWKPNSPVQFNDWNVPSPSYTGGKWKPSSKVPPPSHTKGKWKPSDNNLLSPNSDYPPPTFTGSKWTSSKAQIPPATHTKGKWKPSSEDDGLKSQVGLKKKELISSGGKWKPPTLDPNYTKGKWIPPQNPEMVKKSKITDDDSPFRKSSGTVQYWCRPCNRRLASKIVYERHLKSELHFKRTLHDKEFDDNLGIITEKRQNKKKITNLISISNKSVDKSDELTRGIKRKRRRIFSKCLVCNSKVNNALIGKHLISHYHCRKGDIKSSESREMVLKNIWEVILQSPFQCGICRFYFNHHKDFLAHWLSPHHQKSQDKIHGFYSCSFCKFQHDDSGIMYSHLISEEHEEVVSVINRSVPIVIKKINPVKCDDCNEEFLLNIALKRHCEVEKHNLDKFLSSDDRNFVCLRCRQVFRSNLSLKRHRKNVHKEDIYFCTSCNQEFATKELAKTHRKSSEHRHAIKRKESKCHHKCEFCKEMFTDFLKLKVHLKKIHPQFCPRCLKCGAKFAVPQELSVHLRTNSCSYKDSDSYDPANSCDKCPFTSTSTSELLFHQVLHTEPLLIYHEGGAGDKKKPTQQYKCPLCQKFFPKSSLQAHLRIHTKERPFVCGICKKGFARKNNWMFHVKNHAKKGNNKNRKDVDEETSKYRPFLCSTCGASFQRRSILKQHMTTHTGKSCRCPELGCAFSARTVGELKVHFQTHSDEKNYACQLCDYRGKTKAQLNRHSSVHEDAKKYRCDKCPFSARTVSHLKRHFRLHTGSKPYNCPHCDYKCNSLENLRKHVLSTGKHRGKFIYECKFCSEIQFQTNFAKDLRAHLIADHPQVFGSGSEAASYVAGIYDLQEDAECEKSDCGPQPQVVVVQKPCTLVQDPVSSKVDPPEEIFPMFIVSKDETVAVDNLTETWNLVGSYDVEEESGALVPFHNDSEVLFQDHFQ